jgi:asparagine synthase (glutamine-hydrolysing)
MNAFLLDLSAPGWNTAASVNGETLALKGQTYLHSKPINVNDLAEYLTKPESAIALGSALQSLNGFYAWVTQSGQQIRAGVDHIRSRPLFYGQTNGLFYLSDDAEWIRQQVGDQMMDPIAREEFQLAGYVTGPDTLFPNVKQLQAGECLIASLTATGLVVETHRYYRFLHIEPVAYDETLLRAELDKVAVSVIQRLIDYANGRQIVVPLSGGYDSRLIVTLLKHLGYDNVLTFTYGIKGNKESQYSRRVAKALGYSWTFVEYSNEMWKKLWPSSQAKEYRARAANHVSLPHVQDWPAIKILIENNKIKRDAIIAPGHSGDFVAGSHIPAIVYTIKSFKQNELLQALIDAHLSNSPKIDKAISKDSTIEARLLDRINLSFDGSDVAFANLYEVWDWQERQAKYIVNSTRVYDQFELDWWLPLWDREFVKFWESVPLKLRKQRLWFIDWIIKRSAATSVFDKKLKELRNASDSSSFMGVCLAKKIVTMLPIKILQAIKIKRSYRLNKNHFLAFAGLVPENALKAYIKNQYNIIGIYSDLFISGKWDAP